MTNKYYLANTKKYQNEADFLTIHSIEEGLFLYHRYLAYQNIKINLVDWGYNQLKFISHKDGIIYSVGEVYDKVLENMKKFDSEFDITKITQREIEIWVELLKLEEV